MPIIFRANSGMFKEKTLKLDIHEHSVPPKWFGSIAHHSSFQPAKPSPTGTAIPYCYCNLLLPALSKRDSCSGFVVFASEREPQSPSPPVTFQLLCPTLQKDIK
ncbi:hypothetical protein AVEN_275301-1 [Araneus ventricosus]|uniref:Uncharacterized protein n=1 Tax=Araneus ventricosus TaxID=182803 RepID=A0A4Y2GBV7_ARAVE|nr:hypothetical protein AVEN_275301-1 [Araneus ventricosus]